MNAVDYVLNKGLDKQNAANRYNACNVANLGCSLGSDTLRKNHGVSHGASHGASHDGLGTVNGLNDHGDRHDFALTVNNILYDNFNTIRKKGKKAGNEILHSNTVSNKKREINKSNRGVLLRYMKQQAEYINDLDE